MTITADNSYIPVATQVDNGEDNQNAVDSPMEVTVDPLSSKKHTISDCFAQLPGARDLSWDDDYYDHEDDVVAVFDLDYKIIQEYHKSKVWKMLCCAIFLFADGVFLLSLADPDGDSVVEALAFIFCFPLTGLLVVVAIKYHQKFKAAGLVDLHLAITTNAVRYDEVPTNTLSGNEIHHQIPLSRVVKCDATKKRFKRCCGGTAHTIDMLVLHVIGQRRPTIYLGMTNAQAAQKLVIALQNQKMPQATAVVALPATEKV